MLRLVLLLEPGRTVISHHDRPDLDLHCAGHVVAVEALEGGARHTGGDALDVKQRFPRLVDRDWNGELVFELHSWLPTLASAQAFVEAAVCRLLASRSNLKDLLDSTRMWPQLHEGHPHTNPGDRRGTFSPIYGMKVPLMRFMSTQAAGPAAAVTARLVSARAKCSR